ncbi:neural cell adhesion molecule 2 isoform X2 [Oreochromis niloticus]|uniref:neural cell adhesion molecule 2 isoform X2 n=1 Tax=Oreochromis niloticus TaxID=8128 RepID=UPI0009049223|nr:neural cell adhesion molecule 2 isoform X2 [Oreochromis niloticus]
MSALTAPRCSTLLFAVVVVFVSADPKIIIAKSGQDVTLKCRAPNNKTRAVEWKRTDLLPEYVLWYQDGQFAPANQHPSFKNRVDLQDRQMKHGNLSLILKDVTINDTGTYVCSVLTESTGSLMLISIVYLSVRPDPKIIPAVPGQNVTLTCRAPNNKTRVVKWSRADLVDKHVLLYQDHQFVPASQHPSFKDRVDLQDRQMKDGDVSLILKNVTINDTGTYECHIYMEETHSLKILSIIYLSVVFPPDLKIITAESGQDVTLTCRAPNNNIRVVRWKRTDLGDVCRLVVENGNLVPANQHPSYKNRVDLQDRQMKDGDVSLILKNVTINDAGTYECRVFMNETHSRELISIIYLGVLPPGQTGGQEKDEDNKDGGKEDKEKEDGSVRLIVDEKNMTAESGQRTEGPVSQASSTKLHVAPPGQTGGQEKDQENKDGGKEGRSVRLIVGLSVSAVLLVVVALVINLICRKYERGFSTIKQKERMKRKKEIERSVKYSKLNKAEPDVP